MSGRPINKDRQLAIEFGFMTYTGLAHRRCGTTERYVKGGGCVHCARVIAEEQREARKVLLRHHAEFEADCPEVEAEFSPRDEEIDDERIDIEPEDGLDTDDLDAEARREADIDELM